MRKFLQVISILALLSTIVPGIGFLAGRIELDQVKLLMLLATAIWFVATPLWMERRH